MTEQNKNENKSHSKLEFTDNQANNTITYISHPLKNNNKSIIIATHNIQRMNNITKFQQCIQFCQESQIDIISITETKLANSNHHNYKFLN